MASPANVTTDMPPARTGPAHLFARIGFTGCCATLILMIGFTAFINRLYHKKIHTLADTWAALGDASVKRGDLSSAIVEYRNALAYSPERVDLPISFAQALAATGLNDNEAQNYLVNLWNESPGSGEVNLELARVAAHKPAGYTDALRYYHTAIDGEWTENPVGRRWEVRQELCDYLLRMGKIEQARVEVLALADNTAADDSEHQLVVGQLLLRTQDWNRALNTFRPDGDRGSRECGGDCGSGERRRLIWGQYATARDYFFKLPAERRAAPDVAGMLATAHLVLAADPYLSGLSVKDRALRAENAVTIATARAQSCLATNPRSTPNGPVARAVTQLQQKRCGV